MASQSTEKLVIKVQKATASIPSSESVYRMLKKDPRGFCFIVSIEEFDTSIEGEKVAEDRNGAEVDRKNLEELFKQLGFAVEVLINGTKDGIKEKIDWVRKERKCKNGDMFVAIVLSHGKEGYFITRDNKNYEIEDFITDFNNEGWQPFQGKPKLIIINACRGKGEGGRPDVDTGVHKIDYNPVVGAAQTDNHPGAGSVMAKRVNTEDMMVAFATNPGYAACRDEIRGSWYIQSLCEVFMNQAHNHELTELLSNVSKKLSTFTDAEGKRQCCEFNNRNFCKKLYFNPGNPKPATFTR